MAEGELQRNKQLSDEEIQHLTPPFLDMSAVEEGRIVEPSLEHVAFEQLFVELQDSRCASVCYGYDGTTCKSFCRGFSAE